MPQRNLIKQYRPQSTYHVYSRGHERRPVFADGRDVAVFMAKLRGILSYGIGGHSDPPERLDVELLAYALQPNHFHLLLHQNSDALAIPRLMRGLVAPYANYFNHRHSRSGPVWQRVYRARPVVAGDDRLETVAYIHLNRDGDARSQFTSHPDYLGERVQLWLKPERGLRPFGGTEGYREFIEDRERIRAARRRAGLLDR